MKSPGVEVRPLIDLSNRKMFNEVYFDNVRVPARNLVGEEDRGWYIATTTLDFERSSIGAAVGNRKAVDEIIKFARDHAGEGVTTLGRSSSVSLELCDRLVEAEVAKVMSYRVISMQARGLIPNYEASMTKLYASELSQRISNTSLKVLGLYGGIYGDFAPRRGRWERGYLQAVGATIAGGTSEIQRTIIANRGLGPAPRVGSRDAPPQPEGWGLSESIPPEVSMPVLYEKRDHVAYITLNRPEVLNAFNRAMHQALRAVWEDFREDNDVWVAVLTGAGDRAFSAGQDVKEIGERRTEGARRSFWETWFGGDLQEGLEVWKPIVAAVNGYCLGEGMTLILACDLRIASERASFGFPEVSLGMPTIVGAVRAPRVVGLGNALELLLVGDRVDARRALEMGWCSVSCPTSA
jgi:enoyl-CoA hydratase/carnithine racemase